MPVPAIHFEAKNPVVVADDFAAVNLGAAWMFVDVADLQLVAPLRWSATRSTRGQPYGRAYAGGGRKASKFIKAHRLIMGAPDGVDVDHINGDTLDNRRVNLRLVSRAQNLMNAPAYSHNRSGYRGVCWYPNYGKWRAYIHQNRRTRTLGYFDAIEDAIRARKAAEEELHPGINRRGP